MNPMQQMFNYAQQSAPAQAFANMLQPKPMMQGPPPAQNQMMMQMMMTMMMTMMQQQQQ
jgi:hypothetical protein